MDVPGCCWKCWRWAAEGVAKGVVEGAEMARNDTAIGEVRPSSSFSRFEQTVLDKLDHLTTKQRSNHKFYTSRFQHLDLQIEVVQDQLATMAAWNEPHN